VSVETREYCDLCRKDVTFIEGGGQIYRGRFHRFFHWKGTNEPRGDVTICGGCWNNLAVALREAAAPADSERKP